MGLGPQHWSTSEVGPVADLRWLSAVVDYYQWTCWWTAPG